MKYSQELVRDYSENREKFNETDKVLIDSLESVGVKNKEVLDLGCGDGRHAELIKSMGAAHVVGIDVNEKMIALAKEKTSRDSTLEFVVADGKEIPVENGKMDIVFSNFVLHYFLDSIEVFGEISRVLKTGGYFVGTFNITDVLDGFEYLYNKQMPIRLGNGTGSIVVKNLIKSRQEILQAINDSGFIIEREDELDHPNAVIDDGFEYKGMITKRCVMIVLRKT